MTPDVRTYKDAIVDNTQENKTIVILTDKKKKYIQVYLCDESNSELIKRTQFMRKIGVKSYT